MKFDIRFTGALQYDPDSRTSSRRGQITIGEFTESFSSVLSYWNEASYLQHWCNAIARVVTTGRSSCLITSIADPSESEMLFWWPLYREGDRVYVQNGILLFAELTRPFDPANPYAVIPPRTMLNEEGQRVCEWVVSVCALESFVKSLSQTFEGGSPTLPDKLG
jgi:hypothetical protein